MPINKCSHKSNFTKMPNEAETLSFMASALLFRLLKKPNNWEVKLYNIAREYHLSRNTVSKYINELIEQGYITYEYTKSASGNVTKRYTVNGSPSSSGSANFDNQDLGSAKNECQNVGSANFEISKIEPDNKESIKQRKYLNKDINITRKYKEKENNKEKETNSSQSNLSQNNNKYIYNNKNDIEVASLEKKEISADNTDIKDKEKKRQGGEINKKTMLENELRSLSGYSDAQSIYRKQQIIQQISELLKED